MATKRRTRSSTSEVSSLTVAKPVGTRKRRKPRDLSTTEQEEISKHEIKGQRFTYRLRSVRDILKTISTDAEPQSIGNDGKSSKKSRRSNLRGGKRRSIVDTVLMRNFQLSVEVDKVDGAIVKKPEETQEKENVSIEDAIIQKEISSSEFSENEKETTKISGEKRRQQIIPEESAAEVEVRKEAEEKARERTLENIKKLQDEQGKWIKLYEKYQKQLSDAQINADSDATFSYDDDCFSEEQKEMLAKRIDAQAFVDRLTHYQTRHTRYVEHINDFYQMLQKFKEDASSYIQTFEAKIAKTPEEEADFETPRKLVTKFIENAPNI